MASNTSRRGLASASRGTREEGARKSVESSKGGESSRSTSRKSQSSGARGGSREQHARAGRQSHKRAA